MTAAALSFWNAARLTRTLAAILIGLAIGAAAVIHRDDNVKSMLLRGDFPGFYAPAVIVATGQGAHLYDRELQTAIENKFWPSMQGRVLMSVYPAFFPVMLQPLTALPPLAAKWFFAAICFAGLILFGALGFDPAVRGDLSPPIAALLLSLFPPLLISIAGGQNTGLTLGLIGVIAWAIRQKSQTAKIIAGVALGLLLYKPQFGLPLLIPFLIWREWRTVCVFLVTALALFFLPAPWTGIDWISPWLSATRAFAPENFLINGSRIVSPLAASVNACSFSTAGYVFGILISVAFYLAALARISSSSLPRAELFIRLTAVVAILSPQALFYDLGLAAPFLLAEISTRRDAALGRYAAFAASIIGAFLLVDATGIPVFFAVAVGILICCCSDESRDSGLLPPHK